MLGINAGAIKAYQNIDNATLSGRETEARVLTRAALKLKECKNNWNTPDRKNKLDEALRYNQRVWSIFQEELAMENNPLPQKIKEDILSLSIFIDKRIFEIMAFPAPEKLGVLININQNIAAGLRS